MPNRSLNLNLQLWLIQMPLLSPLHWPILCRMLLECLVRIYSPHFPWPNLIFLFVFFKVAAAVKEVAAEVVLVKALKEPNGATQINYRKINELKSL